MERDIAEERRLWDEQHEYRVQAQRGLSGPEHRAEPAAASGQVRADAPTFLKENCPVLYNHLLLSGKLYPHLAEIDQTAKDRLDRQMEELLKQNPAPDKAVQQMAWVQHMNALKMQAEEVDPERVDFSTEFFRH